MQKPDTIVLIHGLFMTALSWEKWIERYTSRGLRVLARSWPGMDGDIDELRRDPSGVEHLGIGEIVDYDEALVRELDKPPRPLSCPGHQVTQRVLSDLALVGKGERIRSHGKQ